MQMRGVALIPKFLLGRTVTSRAIPATPSPPRPPNGASHHPVSDFVAGGTVGVER
jgi:hypothetical protein